MDRRKKTGWYLLLAVLAVLNLVQLFSNVISQRTIHQLKSKIAQNIFTAGRDSALFINDSLFEVTEQEIFLIGLFGDYNCPSCVKREISYLNDLWRKYPNKIKIFYAGGRSHAMKEKGAIFNYELLEPGASEKLLSESFEFINPVFFLVDSNRRVQALHESDAANPYTSMEFFGRVKSLFESINSQNKIANNSINKGLNQSKTQEYMQ